MKAVLEDEELIKDDEMFDNEGETDSLTDVVVFERETSEIDETTAMEELEKWAEEEKQVIESKERVKTKTKILAMLIIIGIIITVIVLQIELL
jgi:predicted nucleic acid-binding Zn ribbon protein